MSLTADVSVHEAAPGVAPHGVLNGVGVGRGAAIGPVAQVAEPVRPPTSEQPPADPMAATALVRAAFEQVAVGLQARAAAARGPAVAVLSATALMARDPGLTADVERRIQAGQAVLKAVDDATDTVCAAFAAAGGYLAERVTDLRDVRDRVIARILGVPEHGLPELSEPSVLVARDLAPADTVSLDPEKVLAIVTEEGGPTSHTAIIAAQLGVPCLVRVTGCTALRPGTMVAVDAAAGHLLVDPDDTVRADVTRRAEARRLLAASGAGPGQTKDGHKVPLYANVGTVDDAVRAAEQPVEGVGLFRTEFLFLERREAPNQQEQTEAYTKVLGAFGGRRVTVRTIDAGADKPLPFANSDHEENPALGVRGLRLDRRDHTLLNTQLAALAAAREATGADLAVMAPMVSTAAEAREFGERARSYGLPYVGVMIEVPAAALRSRHVLADVDFASIGTNDLTQYALATDRMCGELSDLLDPWQPAVLELVEAAAAGGLQLGRKVGVCGEAASDPLLALVLVGLGVTSLSMAPTAVPAVRFALGAHDKAQCEAIARAAVDAVGPDEGRAAVRELVDPRVLALL